jgi:hypothetical protein
LIQIPPVDGQHATREPYGNSADRLVGSGAILDSIHNGRFSLHSCFDIKPLLDNF